MKFNETDKGICQQVWFLTGTDSTSLPTADIARILNSILKELAMKAWRITSSWKFDDLNHSTFNIATTSLVNNQEDYSLATTDFDVQRVEIIKTDGSSYKLEYLADNDVSGSIDELYKQSGEPRFYRLKGHSILLKPAPDTTKVSTLKIYLSRDISEFSGTDTIKEPGIPSILHPIIPYKIAMEYSAVHGLSNINYIQSKILEWEKIFEDYFANRGEEIKNKLSPKIYNFK